MVIPQEVEETVVDPKAYASWPRIDGAFSWLRENAPLAQLRPAGYEPFWAITRYSDILEVERQFDLFHNGDKAIVLTTLEQDKKNRELNAGSPHQLRTLVHMDSPDHPLYRRLTQAEFLPHNLRKLEPRIREIAREIVGRMEHHGSRCDFARDVAVHYPLRAIMELMGVPPSDEAQMLKLTQENFGSNDPELNRSGATVSPEKMAEDLQKTFAEFIKYFTSITEDRRRCPRDDLASVISNGRIAGQPISHVEAMGYYIIIATAGHDTTANTISGALWALAENQDQLSKLQKNMALLPSFIEESIRWETPVKHFMRQATRDVELAGQNVLQGDQLMLCYASGNRDEAFFDSPFKFNIERSPNKHLAFGFGPHVCLGQHLARMEMRILWEELLPRIASLELDGNPTRSVANFVSGPKTLPIRFKLH